jgi:hypothetical protein
MRSESDGGAQVLCRARQVEVYCGTRDQLVGQVIL